MAADSSSASSSAPLRITAFLRGKITGGKAVVVDKKSSLSEILSKASAKFDLADGTLKHAYTEKDGEISSTDEIFPDDRLFFTTDPIPAPGAPQTQSVPAGVGSAAPLTPSELKEDESDPAKQGFLRSVTQQVVSAAATVYDKSSTFVKGNAPIVIKTTIENLEGTVASFAGPVVSKVVEYGDPLLGWADSHIDLAQQKATQATLQLKAVQAQFFETAFAKTVNEKLVLPAQAAAGQVRHARDQFIEAAQKSYLELDKDHDGVVGLEDFVGSLRTKLGSAWNDKLAEPAKAYYVGVREGVEKKKQSATEALTAIKANLDKTWEDKVVTNFKSRVVVPAEAFAQVAIDSYRTLDANGDGKVSADEFVAGLRLKLGQLWNKSLVEPARQLYKVITENAEVKAAIALVPLGKSKEQEFTNIASAEQ